MSDEDLDSDFDEGPEEELPTPKDQTNERKRFIREQIELRTMAKELGLSPEDYLEAFGD
jgi:hypothetical protein